MGQSKGQSKGQKKTDDFISIKNSISSGIAGIFVILMFGVFPLVYYEKYFEILRAKYFFYCVIVLLMIVSIVMIQLIFLFIEKNEFDLCYTKAAWEDRKNRKRNWVYLLPELSLAVFWLVSALSTLFSDFLFEAFWGNEGRLTGLFLISLYVISLYLVSKYLDLKQRYLNLFLFISMLACLMGIIQYMGVNIAGFRTGIQNPKNYISTFGNINSYTAFVGMVLGVSTVLFAAEKQMKWLLFYYTCTAIAFMAIITGNSDNAYLSLGALFAFLPFYLWKNRQGFLRYLILIATFFSVMQIVDVINTKYEGQVDGIDSLFQMIAGSPYLAYIVIALWLFVGIFYLRHRRLEKGGMEKLSAFPRILWFSFLCLVLLCVIYVLCDANLFGNAQRYDAIRNFVVFDDAWGTNRGFIWRAAWENYKDFSPLHKLFGYGAETFGLVMKFSEFHQIGLDRYNEIFDSAHNEYLQYFITLGPIALSAYLVLLVSAGVRIIKRACDNPCAMAALFAVLCYAVQSVVNVNPPVITPLMWTLLAFGLAGCRESIRDNCKK